MQALEIYNKTAEALAPILGKGWMKNLMAESIEVISKQIPNSELEKEITKFAPTQGWVQTLNEVTLFTNQLPKGTIQSAEFINAKGDSLHIRPAGNQSIVTEYKKDQGKNYICGKYKQAISVSGLDDGQKEAYYKVYWNENDTKQPKYSRFISIKDIPNKEKK